LNNTKKPWVAGNSLCYWKSFWQRNPFLNINVGEDAFFLWSSQPKRVVSLPRADFMIALIHPGNISNKRAGVGWEPCSESRLQRMFRKDWEFYRHLFAAKPERKPRRPYGNLRIYFPTPVSCIMPPITGAALSQKQSNIFFDRIIPT
jgi:hypothetical protein